MAVTKVGALCIVLGSSLFCGRSARGPDIKILDVLDDFKLVGITSAKFDADGTVDTTYTYDHGDAAQAKPDSLQTRTAYIFQPRNSTDSERMALRIIPERLSKLGFKLIEAPKSTGDLMYLIYGGPIFHIKFSDGRHEGLIFNQGAAATQGSATYDDYVLVFTK